MSSRRLAQLSALALMGLAYWFMSRPEIVGDEYVGMILLSFLAVTLAFFGLAFLTLRWATGGSATFWTMKGTDQVAPVLLMILTILAAMFAGYGLLHLIDRLTPLWLRASYFLSCTLVPAAFLLSGRVRWPVRLAHPGRLALASFFIVGIGLAAAWGWIGWRHEAGSVEALTADHVLFVVPVTVLGATLEEVIFRVLLLTALLDRTGSRFNAVFLSSVAFGLMHVPGTFVQPLTEADWPLLQSVAQTYAPMFLMQVALGLFLGVLWLRSGSLVLIASVHTLANLGLHLANGL